MFKVQSQKSSAVRLACAWKKEGATGARAHLNFSQNNGTPISRSARGKWGAFQCRSGDRRSVFPFFLKFATGNLVRCASGAGETHCATLRVECGQPCPRVLKRTKIQTFSPFWIHADNAVRASFHLDNNPVRCTRHASRACDLNWRSERERQRAGALQDAIAIFMHRRNSRQRLGVRRPSAAFNTTDRDRRLITPVTLSNFEL